MISESELWKQDLIKIANKLLRRMVQKKWSQRSFFTMEKELFIGFYSVRKLIESYAVSQKFIRKRYKLLLFPRRVLPKREIGKMLPYELSPSQTMQKVTIKDICNQFIHSKHLVPFGANRVLIGFFITSEFQSKNGIYLITMYDIAEIFMLCAGRKGLAD